MKSVLGISAYYHDSAAAILVDGNIIAAAQEERFTRKKHDSSYPYNAIEFVLKQANLKLIDIDYFAKFLALLALVNDPHSITGDNLLVVVVNFIIV